jgi:squalene-associated FAD-dependent desaturase
MEDGATERMSTPGVAVVGAGWAGCAAAVMLAHAGMRVTLLEQAATPGGRARRVTLDGMALDNGQHLLLGACRQTLRLIRHVHRGDPTPLFRRLPFMLTPFGAARPDAVSLRARFAPAPFHLLLAALAAHGLSLGERIALAAAARRLFRAAASPLDRETVVQCLADAPLRTIAGVWEPFCISALNTPPDTASARAFGRVVREAFTGSARNSDMLIPLVDLSALFPDAAARYLRQHGGALRFATTVRAVAPKGEGVDVVVGEATERFDAAIVAVGPHQLAPLLDRAETTPETRAALDAVAAYEYESITTVYLAYAERLPLRLPVMRLDDAPGQWLFDRSAASAAELPQGARSLVAVVISTSGPHDALPQPALADQVDAQLRRLGRQWPLPLWSRVIAEQRATYACQPGLARPASPRLGPCLYLAGDYTDPALPATLEAATRSGVAAAQTLLDDRKSHRQGVPH